MNTDKNEPVKPSRTKEVDDYMNTLKHPLFELVVTLRKLILASGAAIGEEIKWNAPAFYYTGPLKTFNPKEYKRHIVVFNLAKKDCIRLIFLSGARINDRSGFLEGDYADGRRIATFYTAADVNAKKNVLQKSIATWLKTID